MINNINALDASTQAKLTEAINNGTIDEQSLSAFITNSEVNVNAQDVLELSQAAGNNVSGQENQEGVKKYQLTAESKKNIEKELEEDKKVYDKKVAEMEKIEKQVTALSNEVSKNIAQALVEQNAIVAQNKQTAQSAVDEEIQKYISANKNGGEGMTREQLQANIKKSIPNMPNATNALAAIALAEDQVAQIDDLLVDLNVLAFDTKGMELRMNANTDLIQNSSLIVEQEPTPVEQFKSQDPIGFVASNNVQYDFFIDKDGNGDLSQTNEFLGADAQWTEMAALDTDFDGSVNIDELVSSQVQLKGSDGSIITTAEDYEKAFGKDFSIDINSYTSGGYHSAVDTTKDSDNDGTMDQQLLGTFVVNENGTTTKGYNTLDDVDWLSEQYDIKVSQEDKTSNNNEAVVSTQTSEIVRPYIASDKHIQFYDQALERNAKDKVQINEIKQNQVSTVTNYANASLAKATSNEKSEDSNKKVEEEKILIA